MSSCNLVKLLLSTEQKPVSLNDIVTYGALIKNESDFLNELSSLIVTVNLLKMIVVIRLFGFF